MCIKKLSPYVSKGILRHYSYQLDPKLCPGIVAIRRITFSCHAFTTISYLSWESKTKEVFNQPRFSRAYNFIYSQIISCHNIWIIMIFLMMEQMKNIMNTLI